MAAATRITVMNSLSRGSVGFRCSRDATLTFLLRPSSAVTTPLARYRSSPVFLCSGRIRPTSSAVDQRRRAATENRQKFETAGQFSGFIKLSLEGEEVVCSATWLRENCRCTDCYTAATSQRSVLFHRLHRTALTIKDAATEVGSPGQEGHVHVTWSDGHRSTYGSDWLKRMTRTDDRHPTAGRKCLWDASAIADFVERNRRTVTFDELINREEPVKALLSQIWRYGIGLIDGCPASLEATEKAVGRIAFPLRTFYGTSWEFSNEVMEFKDTAYTNQEIGSHNDCTYFTIPAGLQVFQCLHHDGSGGENMLVDGFNCAEQLRSKFPKAFRTLQRSRLSHDFADPELKHRSVETILKVDPITDELEWIRYNPYDRSPFCITEQWQLPEIYEAIAPLARLIEEPANEYRLKLTPGTVLVLDNWRVLHGRKAFTGVRRMCGFYVSRDDWMRAARIHGIV